MKSLESKILSIWAHADDSAWTSGGTIARFSGQSQIDGLLFTDSNGQGFGRTRLEEERKAMDILGMRTLYPVGDDNGFKDGWLSNEHRIPMITALLHIIDSEAQRGMPYTGIITFGTDGYSGHLDHIVVALVALEVFRLRDGLKSLWQVGMSAEERLLWGDYFVPIPEVDTSNYHSVDIQDTYKRKIAALEAHKTQMDNGGSSQIARIEKLPKVEVFNILPRP